MTDVPFQAKLSLRLTGANWGEILGDIQDQPDLINLVDNATGAIQGEVEEISANLSALGTTVSDNYIELDGKISDNATAINNHIADKTNPHEVTKAQVGLGNVDNTSDLNKPISTATQTALDGKIDKLSTKPTAGTYTKVTITNEGLVSDGTTLSEADIPSLHLTKITDVTSTAAEVNQLHESGAVQSDFIKLHGITSTAAELNILDGATLTTEELNYVDGVTSDIQTQINSKQATITGAATTVTSDDLTTGRVIISNSNGKIDVSSITSTELGYLDNVTSNVQTQFNNITDLIPNEATSSNQLADKSFVNSSISTNTANFIGTFNSVSDLEAYSGTVTNNDYAFVVNNVITDNGDDWATYNALNAYDKSLLTNFDYAWVINGSNFDLYRFDILNQQWDLRVSNTPKASVTLNVAYNRYKATVSGSTVTWDFEYTLNNSSFTASQWAAINSGATAANIGQISTNTNDISTINTTIGGYGNIVTHNVSEFATASQGAKADTAVQPSAIANMQTTTNLVTSVSSSSTDSQYPSAKLFYDTIGDLETVLHTINSGNN